MAWIKVDQTICTHKKPLKLACKLGIDIPQAIGLMVTLWLWAIDNAPDGSLEDIEAPLLARAMLLVTPRLSATAVTGRSLL